MRSSQSMARESAQPTRHQLGQWFTPEPVADLALLLATRGQTQPGRIVDPSCGDGVFLQRALQLGLASTVCGVDVDEVALASARTRVPKADLVHGDFFDAQALQLEDLHTMVGNPPYVRQERVPAHHKGKMLETLVGDWPSLPPAELEKLVAQGDMAAPFLLKCMHQLAPGGRAAFVLSSAFFDTGYGVRFWRLLKEVASLELVVDAPEERWFQEAAVHTVVALLVRHGEPRIPPSFARLRVPTSLAAERLRGGAAIEELAELRPAARETPEAWAAALRAPSEWFAFAKAAGSTLVPLGELCEIRRGLTSGANDIFYIERSKASALNIAAAFLLPLLRAPGKGGHGRIEVIDDACEFFALVLPPMLKLEDHPAIAAYLHGFADAERRASLAARNPWWSLSVRPAQVFLSKAYSERFVQPFCRVPIVADQRVYCLHPRPGVDAELLAAVLNATPTALALESLGRASMGQGALEWSVGDAAHLPVIDPRKLAEPASVRRAFRSLCTRHVGKVRDEADCQDRRALDAGILSAGGTLLEHQRALAEALVAAVDGRLRRSRV